MGRAKVSATGVALDIGTTTVAGAAVEMSSLAIIKTASRANPQSAWGADVISRIEAVEKEPEALGKMQRAVTEACNEIIAEVAGSGPVTAVSAAGNTVMEHIFSGTSPVSMARAPYRPVFRKEKIFSAEDVGLGAPGATVFLFPVVGAFVGGDAVAAAVALGLVETGEKTLLVDIGTNSEIILAAGGVLRATSAAAGPAFEAAGIRSGMTAERGAIKAVSIRDGRFRIDVIGGVSPKGICGSGLVDAVAALLEADVIDSGGRIKDPDEVEGVLSTRIREKEGGNEFVLFRGASVEIVLTQEDIRALQTAKSAIRAGINMLLERSGLEPGEMERIYIAGAFGSSLRPESLAAIGLIERSWCERVTFVGDAALKGAALALGEKGREAAKRVAEGTKYQPLSGSRFFEREFLKNMDFPVPAAAGHNKNSGSE